MVKAYDWWEMIPNAVCLLDAAAQSLISEQKSIMLLLPRNIPWHNEMQKKLEIMLDDPEKTFEILDCPEDVQPAQFVLNNYFKNEVKLKFMPTKGYETLIAENDGESRFKNAIIFLRMKSESQLRDWTKFVIGYEKEKRSSASLHGLFILEYCSDTPPKISPSLPAVKWSDHIHDYDKHVYAMLSVSYVRESQPVLEYLSEFISLLSGNDVEFASELAKHGIECINAPQKVFEKINARGLRSDDSVYEISFSEKQLESIFWQAQIKVLFPQIEKFKNKMIAENKHAFDDNFKFVTAYGKEKNNYQELEIGEILHMHYKGDLILDEELVKKAILFKKGRDCLAHFSSVPFDDTIKMLNEKL